MTQPANATPGSQPFLKTPWARSPIGDVPERTPDLFKWATVTQNDPLRIKFDGETIEVPVTPDTLVDPTALDTGDRVWCQQWGSRIIVLGRGGGLP